MWAPDLDSGFMLALMDFLLNIIPAEKHCFETYISGKSSPSCGDAKSVYLPTDFWGDAKLCLDETMTHKKVVQQVIIGCYGFVWC